MSAFSSLVRTPRGICIVPGTFGAEHTLCGDAFDLGSDEEGYEWSPVEGRTITCPDCAAIVSACQGYILRPRKDRP